MSQVLPELVFSEKALSETVAEHVTPASLIVTDEYNYAAMVAVGPTLAVCDQRVEHVAEVRRDYVFDNVIAVGGCTALDFGRACAVGWSLIAVPTILSTSCLSTNCSVVNENGVYRSIVTQAPWQTIISVPTIVENHRDQIKKWSISGLGDLFASLSASIELEYFRRGATFERCTLEDIKRNIPTVMAALDWAEGDADLLDEESLRALARVLHEASLDVIRHGQAALNAASEHWLFYRMQETQHYPRMIATHGKLVSIGTLISSRLFAEATGEFRLDERLHRLHRKLGLPASVDDLAALGVKLDHITSALQALAGRDCLYARCFARGDYSIVSRIFPSR